jgi:hypothetical protein
MEGRNVRLRERLVILGRRTVRRQRRARLRRSARAVRPALLIVREVRGVHVVQLELPHAVLFDELVLVDAAHPGAGTAEGAELAEGAAAHLGGLAIRRDGDHGLELHVVVQVVGLDVLRPEQMHRLADAGLTHIDAALRDLHGGVFGKQIDEIVPLLLVEVVAVGGDQVLDGVDVFQTLDARLERRHRAFQLGNDLIDGSIVRGDAQRRDDGCGKRAHAERGKFVRLHHCAPPLPGFSK